MKWTGFSPVIGNCLRLKRFQSLSSGKHKVKKKVIEEKEKINHFSL
jgi:hypothetical protein